MPVLLKGRKIRAAAVLAQVNGTPGSTNHAKQIVD
jgi:hypothetical protein